MAYIKKIKLPNNDQVYDICDAGAARKEALDEKQDKIIGTAGQIVQINAEGKAEASSLINIEDIDEICGTSIQLSSEVTF